MTILENKAKVNIKNIIKMRACINFELEKCNFELSCFNGLVS